MSDKTRVRLIVGVNRDDLTDDRIPQPLIAGCIDHSTWEIIDWDESEEWAAELRARFDPPPGDMYEWREVVASFDTDALRSIFQTLAVDGAIEEPA